MVAKGSSYGRFTTAVKEMVPLILPPAGKLHMPMTVWYRQGCAYSPCNHPTAFMKLRSTVKHALSLWPLVIYENVSLFFPTTNKKKISICCVEKNGSSLSSHTATAGEKKKSCIFLVFLHTLGLVFLIILCRYYPWIFEKGTCGKGLYSLWATSKMTAGVKNDLVLWYLLL